MNSAPGTSKGFETHDDDFPSFWGRDDEARLLALTASGRRNVDDWMQAGPPFFMAGVAVMLASLPSEDRRRLLVLAERLHPGSSEPAVFEHWLARSPLRPSRFLPMLRMELAHVA